MEQKRTQQEQDYIQHFGILGMHWGIRRTPEQLGHRTSPLAKWKQKREAKRKERQRAKAVKDFEKKTTFNNVVKSYNKATDKMNEEIDKINEEFKDYDFSIGFSKTEAGRKYLDTMGQAWTKIYKEQLLSDIGEHPDIGKEWVDTYQIPFMDMYKPEYYDQPDTTTVKPR